MDLQNYYFVIAERFKIWEGLRLPEEQLLPYCCPIGKLSNLRRLWERSSKRSQQASVAGSLARDQECPLSRRVALQPRKG